MSDHPVLRTALGALGLPLCIALCFSLLIALVFLPVVSARILGDRPALLQRGAGLLAPIGALPARAIGYVVGGLRFAFYGLARLLYPLNRLAGRPARPLARPPCS